MTNTFEDTESDVVRGQPRVASNLKKEVVLVHCEEDERRSAISPQSGT